MKFKKKDENVIQIAPEYEDCRRIAAERGLGLAEVMDRIRREAGLLAEKEGTGVRRNTAASTIECASYANLPGGSLRQDCRGACGSC